MALAMYVTTHDLFVYLYTVYSSKFILMLDCLYLIFPHDLHWFWFIIQSYCDFIIASPALLINFHICKEIIDENLTRYSHI